MSLIGSTLRLQEIIWALAQLPRTRSIMLWPDCIPTPETVLEDDLLQIDSGDACPMICYFIGGMLSSWMILGRAENAGWPRRCPDYCFPNRLEEILAFTTCYCMQPAGAQAPYYLGNFWYHHVSMIDAMENWECYATGTDNTSPRFVAIFLGLF